jgi:hypothetical protein
VVLLGASRMQLDIDLDQFARRFNGIKPNQLAVGWSSPVPVLNDLSNEPSFRGIVICDIVPNLFYVGRLSPENGIQADYVRGFHATVGSGGRSILPLVEARLRTIVQQKLLFRRPTLSPTSSNVLAWLEAASLPPPSGRVMLADRSQRADLKSLAPAVLRHTEQLWVERIDQAGYGPPDEVFRRDLEALESMVRRIQARGGRVIFASFPVTGMVRAAEEERQPRNRYWDVLASLTTATTIHFLDYPELAAFECPEGSHLDYRDTTRFTAALVSVIKRRLNGVSVSSQGVHRLSAVSAE